MGLVTHVGSVERNRVVLECLVRVGGGFAEGEQNCPAFYFFRRRMVGEREYFVVSNLSSHK